MMLCTAKSKISRIFFVIYLEIKIKRVYLQKTRKVINQQNVTRIPLNPDEYEAVMALFRVRGERNDGTAEKRGRRKKAE